MSMICAEVVPRTMESSTSSTFLPRNSRSMALSLLRTDFGALFLARHDEGAANVAILDEPLAIFDAEQLRDLHGAWSGWCREIGMTTSMPCSGRSRLIFSARRSPSAGAPCRPRCCR